MSRQISMFMQLSWFVLVFKERYFIKHVTHILVYFRVFSLTMISQNLLCLFESLRFFNVMSNINVHATLMICISLWRKVFHHGDWFRRWLILYWVKKNQILVWSLVFEFSQQRRITIHFIMTLMNGFLCFESVFINLSRLLD
jgi:hypothetical protein